MSLDLALLDIERACGSGSVIRDPDVLATYAHDESETPEHLPDAVVRASSTKDVAAVLRAANAHGIPVTPRAGGTGRVGGAVPVKGGIVLAFERMNDLKGIERDDLYAVVQPGLVTGRLHASVEEERLFYPPDPNSLASCALGGNIAANAGGPRAFKYGVTREYVLGMEVVMADGTILHVGKRTVKGVTGFDLTALLVGSEGTLGIVTEATLRLVPLPESVATLLVFLPDDASVGAAVTRILGQGVVPRCVELLDSIALDLVRPDAGLDVPAAARAMLLVEIDGHESVLGAQVERIGQALVDAGALDVLVAQNASERERLWAARRELSRTLRKTSKWKLSEDVVVPRTRIADLLAHCRRLAETHGIVMPTYGHAGDGNLHVNFLWNDPSQRPAVDAAIESLFREVVAMQGTLSGEHGIGVLKAPYLPLEQSDALIALQERVKAVFDPKGILNPGKIFPGPERKLHGSC
ncbi:MAG: FAD-linked oxidase C-terminal domain-containing protein [Polyangiales bacterium]